MSNPLGNIEDEFPEVRGECIVGWRQWGTHSGDLTSLNEGEVWDYLEPFEAQCQSRFEEDEIDNHLSPHRECTCGIYVAKTLSDLSISGYTLDRINDQMAIGRVKIWGKIIPHTNGYRAQYAYPDLIITPNPLVADLIARNYRCEVIIPEIERVVAPSPEVSIQRIIADPIPEVNFKSVCINLTMNGLYRQYNGPWDHTAIGRWFASCIVELSQQRMTYSGQYHQIQISFGF